MYQKPLNFLGKWVIGKWSIDKRVQEVQEVAGRLSSGSYSALISYTNK